MIAGWSSLVARWAHNPKVGGSNPSPATIKKTLFNEGFLCDIMIQIEIYEEKQCEKKILEI